MYAEEGLNEIMSELRQLNELTEVPKETVPESASSSEPSSKNSKDRKEPNSDYSSEEAPVEMGKEISPIKIYFQGKLFADIEEPVPPKKEDPHHLLEGEEVQSGD